MNLIISVLYRDDLLKNSSHLRALYVRMYVLYSSLRVDSPLRGAPAADLLSMVRACRRGGEREIKGEREEGGEER